MSELSNLLEALTKALPFVDDDLLAPAIGELELLEAKVEHLQRERAELFQRVDTLWALEMATLKADRAIRDLKRLRERSMGGGS